MLRRATLSFVITVLSFVTIVLSVSQVTIAQNAAPNTKPNAVQQWWKHIEYLASDELAGRETLEAARSFADYCLT